MTHDEAVRKLDALESGDAEVAHCEADAILCRYLEHHDAKDIADAWDRACDRAGFWKEWQKYIASDSTQQCQHKDITLRSDIEEYECLGCGKILYDGPLASDDTQQCQHSWFRPADNEKIQWGEYVMCSKCHEILAPASDGERTEMSTLRCHWCSQFLSKDKAKATVKNPEIFYCAPCFQKGVEMENEAMGLYDV